MKRLKKMCCSVSLLAMCVGIFASSDVMAISSSYDPGTYVPMSNGSIYVIVNNGANHLAYWNHYPASTWHFNQTYLNGANNPSGIWQNNSYSFPRGVTYWTVGGLSYGGTAYVTWQYNYPYSYGYTGWNSTFNVYNPQSIPSWTTPEWYYPYYGYWRSPYYSAYGGGNWWNASVYLNPQNLWGYGSCSYGYLPEQPSEWVATPNWNGTSTSFYVKDGSIGDADGKTNGSVTIIGGIIQSTSKVLTPQQEMLNRFAKVFGLPVTNDMMDKISKMDMFEFLLAFDFALNWSDIFNDMYPGIDDYTADTDTINKFVEDMYYALLGREADDVGRSFYVAQIEDGQMSTSEFMNALITSEEFKNKYGSFE